MRKQIRSVHGTTTLGVARHFPVSHNRFKVMNAQEFSHWIHWYDQEAQTTVLPFPEVSQDWDVCYCSNLERAVITASALYRKPILFREALREVPFAPVLFPWPLPLMIWKILSRLGWWLDLPHQVETRMATRKRAESVLADIVNNHPGQRVLLITHGFFMQCLRRQVRELGFAGQMPLHPQGGTIYRFTREQTDD